MIGPVFRWLMYYAGIGDRSAIAAAELDAYVELLKREDGGRAFLKIMRGFEMTASKQALYTKAVRDLGYPVQVVWGADDPALKLSVYGEQARRLTRARDRAYLAGQAFPAGGSGAGDRRPNRLPGGAPQRSPLGRSRHGEARTCFRRGSRRGVTPPRDEIAHHCFGNGAGEVDVAAGTSKYSIWLAR